MGGKIQETNISSQAELSTSAGFTTTGIMSRLCAVISVVCMFMPWVSMLGVGSPQGIARTVGNGLSASYEMFNLGALGNALVSLYGKDAFGAVKSAFFVAWIFVLVLVIFSLVWSLVGKKSVKLLAIAGIAVVLLAVFWAVAVFSVNGAYTLVESGIDTSQTHAVTEGVSSLGSALSTPIAVYLTIAAGFLTFVFGVTKGKRLG